MTPAAAEQSHAGLSIDHRHRGGVGRLDDDPRRRDRGSSCRRRRTIRWAPGSLSRGDSNRSGRCSVDGRLGGGRRRADAAALAQLGETGELLFVEFAHWQFHTPLSSSCGFLQPGGIGGIGLLAGQSLGMRAPCGTPAIAGAAVVTVGDGGCVGAAVVAGAGGCAVGDGAAVATGVGAPAVVTGAAGLVGAGDSGPGASGAAPALSCGGAAAMAPGAGVSAGAAGASEAAVAGTAVAADAARSAAPAMVSAVVSEWTTM